MNEPEPFCRFTVPGNIVPWGRSRTSHGRHFTAPKVASYQGAIRASAFEAMRGRDPLDGPCRVVVTATFLRPASWSRKRRAETFYHASKPDADNILKQLDALNGIVWTDDARVSDARVLKPYGDAPGMVVQVWDLVRESTGRLL